MTTGKQESTKKQTVTPEQKIEILENITFEIIDKLEKLTEAVEGIKKTAVTKPKGLFGGKREAVPIKDLSTGIVYRSMAHVNKEFGTEIGIDPLVDTLGYYKIEKKLRLDNGEARFVPANEEEATAARDKYKKELEEEVARRNAELEAEQAKQAPEEKPAPAKKK